MIPARWKLQLVIWFLRLFSYGFINCRIAQCCQNIHDKVSDHQRWAGVLHYQSQFPELKLNKQTLNIASDDAHISHRNSGMSPCAYHHPRCRTYKQLDNAFEFGHEIQL